MERLRAIIKKYQRAFSPSLLLPILSGILVGTSYMPFPPWAVLFCYVPLWLWSAQEEFSLKQIFWSAWLTQFLLTIIGFHWIAYTAHEFGQFPWLLAIPTLLLFAALMHIYIPLSLVVAVWLHRRFRLNSPAYFLSAALTLALAERIWPSIFPWHLGYTLLAAKLPIYNWADVIGFHGLSTLLLLANAAIASAVFYYSRNRIQTYFLLGAVVLLTVFLNVTGSLHGKKWSHFDDEWKTLAVQGNIGNVEKIFAEVGQYSYQSTIVQKFTQLTAQGLNQFPQVETVIWPETAFPDALNEFYAVISPSQSVLRQHFSLFGKSLLTGAYSRDQVPQANGKRNSYNALFLTDSNGKSFSPPYHKTQLLAFGEYLPLSEQFPILLQWLPFISNFGRGQGPQILQLPTHSQGPIKIGGQICYEGLDADFSRGLSALGANVLVNVTNDSWFGDHFEPQQHMYMTFARAIETRRPLLRVTNTGHTSAILANGEVQEISPMSQPWFGEYTIRFLRESPQTLYVLGGHYDWILWLILLILTVWMKRNERPLRT